jgi:hypothetical protein
VTAARTDANQPAIVAALRKAGAQVCHLHAVGGGVPDLLVSRGGKMWLIEIKMPGKKPNALQSAWHKAWAAPVHVVVTPVEALLAIGVVP